MYRYGLLSYLKGDFFLLCPIAIHEEIVLFSPIVIVGERFCPVVASCHT